IDISDPTHMQQLGALEMPGWVSYLQPIDSTHLLGVGRDMAPTQGTLLRLALFDVSDPAHPRLVSQYDIQPANWTWWWGSGSAAEWDHHAVGYFPEYQTLAIPVYGSYTTPDWSGFQSSLWVFKVDPAQGFTLAGTIQ